jgi:cytochrome P450
LATAIPLFRPPAPEPRPKQLSLPALLRALKRNPLECWAEEHFEQAIITATRALGHVFVINDPDAIRHVLLDNAANYHKHTFQQRVCSAGLANGLLSAEAEQWRVQRRTLAPMFSRKMVTSFGPVMLNAADQLVARWFDLADAATIDATAEMGRVVFDVLEHTIFSDGLGGQPEKLRGAMATYFDTIGTIEPLDVFGVPDFIPRPSRLRVRSTLHFFDAAIDQLIALRRSRINEDPECPPYDILTLLLRALDPETGQAMTETEVRSNVLTFMAAGYETTANCLSWSLFLLAQSPEWQDRVAAEACAEADTLTRGCVDHLVITRAVIEEALRLYPPIAATTRMAIHPDTLGNMPIRPRSMIVIAPYVLHRHRRLWDWPDFFDPGRFIGDARTKISRFAYLPFGTGVRTCIGAAFALQEATLILATIMRHFVLEVMPGHAVWPSLRVTLRPFGGVPLLVRRRREKGRNAPGDSSPEQVCV